MLWWKNRGGSAVPDDIATRVNLAIAIPKRLTEKQPVRELIVPMETVLGNLAGISEVVGLRHIVWEIATSEEAIVFYVNVPMEIAEFVEKQITSQYPDATVERASYPNIFPEEGKVAAIELALKRDSIYPIRTYNKLETDGLNAITNALSKMTAGKAGAAVQVLMRPTPADWQKRARGVASQLLQGKKPQGIAEGVAEGFRGFLNTDKSEDKAKEPVRLSSLQEEVVTQIEGKANKAGFEVVVRLITAAPDKLTAQANLKALMNSFLQFGATELNQFEARSIAEAKVIHDYVLRQFGDGGMILNAEEIATIYHLPHGALETPNIKWMRAKRLMAPENLPKEGTILGENVFRGEKRVVRIARDDRRRHTYVVGKTGTGKSTWLQNLALQDIENGEGVCFIDPHGEAIEWLLARIPKERVEDVIHFYPPDIDKPLGLNLLEAKTPAEKDMVVSEMISIFYKLFDPQGSGVVGPIFEHYMRNAMLLLLADTTEGATLIDIPRVFTDAEYRNKKIEHLTDPTVLRFWKEEFAQAQKSNQAGELFSYIISKIGRFLSNEMMRNIVGQEKSAFDLREVMDGKKILLVNLAKGLTGEINSNLLGFILVSKLQMAALSRADRPGGEYPDFYLYIDEFQNVTTDSIATILSEARKYRLNMIMAHQFMAQLDVKIRDAVIGNVGTMVAFRVGAPDAESLVKEFEPEVTQNDLVNIESRNAYIKLMIDGAASKPFTLQTLAPMGTPNVQIGEAIKQLTRLKFGASRAVVEAGLKVRLRYNEK